MGSSAREIRIHGVSGTAPAGMLSRDGDAAPHRVASYIDQLTGFYSLPPSSDEPQDIEVEAYSWGTLTSGGGRVGERVRRIGWLTLLPFALVNVSYWARPGLERSDRKTPEGRSRRATAIAVRWGALLMTMALIGTVAWVSVDLLAWQCFRGGRAVCEVPGAIAGTVDVLGTAPWNSVPRRVIIACLAPVAALVVLVLLSNQARGRYESVKDHHPGETHLQPTHLDGCQVILRRPKMWSGSDRVRRQQWLHVAAGMSVVLLYATVPVLRATVPRFDGLGSYLLAVACALAVLAVGLAMGSAWFSVGDGNDFFGSPDPRERLKANRLAFGATAAVIVGAVLAVSSDFWLLEGSVVRDGQDLSGNDLFIGLVFGLLSLITAFLFFASRSRPAAWVAVLGMGGVVWIGWLLGQHRAGSDTVWGIVFSVVLIVMALVGGLNAHARLGGRRADTLAWRGAGPALFLGAGTLVAMIFTVVVAVGAADLLNGSPPVTAINSSFSSGYTTLRIPGSVVVPNVLLWVVTLLPLWFAALLAIVAGSRWQYRRTVGDSVTAFATQEGIDESDLGRCSSARLTASFTHRAERLIGRIGIATVAFALAVAMGAVNGEEPWARFERLRLVGDLGLYFTILIGGGLVWFASKVRTSNEARRQVGILWDLSTFWPRAAHPFGPPCYAERVVPEVLRRVRASLAEGKLVILSGHSQGSVIAVAVASRLSDRDLRNVRLVTYGSQLRAWFGRIFPGVLGPDALGIAPISPPWTFHGPWPDAPSSDDDSPSLVNHCPWSLRHRIDGPGDRVRWVNLFRRTDPIGFPIFSDAMTADGRDLRVHELDDRFDLGTHSGYQFTSEYEEAVRDWVTEAETASGASVGRSTGGRQARPYPRVRARPARHRSTGRG